MVALTLDTHIDRVAVRRLFRGTVFVPIALDALAFERAVGELWAALVVVVALTTNTSPAVSG